MSIGERIRAARKVAGMSQKALADKVGMKQPTLSELETGESAGTTYLPSIAAALGVNPLWLERGTGSPKMQEPLSASAPSDINLVDNPDYPAIRRVNLRLSAGICGYSVDYDDDSGDMIVFGRRWYEKNNYKPEKLIAIRVQGHSMETGLNQNDTVVINTADNTPRDGEVFAVNYDGEAVIKRMVRDRSEWWLASDNPDQVRYPRKLCTGEGCIIIGRVVHKQSERI